MHPSFKKMTYNHEKGTHIAAGVEFCILAVTFLSLVIPIFRLLVLQPNVILANQKLSVLCAAQIDTRVSNNLIGRKRIFDTQIKPSSSTLVMWSGFRMQPYRECVLKLIDQRNKTKYKFSS